MAWEFVAVSTLVETTTTTHTLTEPAGAAEGDLLVACIGSRKNSTNSTGASTLPSGWNLVQRRDVNNAGTNTNAQASGLMAWIRRGSSAPDLTFTHQGATFSVGLGRVMAYRGAAASNPLDTSNVNVSSLAVTAVDVAAGVTTSQANDLLVALRVGGQESTVTDFTAATSPTTGSGTGSSVTAAPANDAWQERCDDPTSTGNDVAISVFDAVKTAAGSTGNLTCTASQASEHVVILAAFKIAAAASVAADAGSYALTGTAATPKHGWKAAADSGSYALTGTVASLEKGYKLAADAGSYSLTGTDASLEHGWKVAADAGSYGLTGTVAALRRNLPLVPDSGSYAVSGTVAALRQARKVTADVGSYSATGTDASLEHGWKVVADAGSYSLSGTDATLTKGGGLNNYSIAADAGSYAVSGADADVEHGWRVVAEAGAYSLSGTDAGLRHAWKVAAAAGSYAITGVGADIEHGWRVAADSGSYALSGTNAALRHAWKIAAAAGSYTSTGTAADTEHGWRVAAEVGSYSLTGADAALEKSGAYAIVAEAGSYSLTGSSASVVVARKLVPDNGNYLLAGVPAGLSLGSAAPELPPPVFVSSGTRYPLPTTFPAVRAIVDFLEAKDTCEAVAEIAIDLVDVDNDFIVMAA